MTYIWIVGGIRQTDRQTDRHQVYQLLQLGLHHELIHRRLRTRVANDCRTKHRGQVVKCHLTCNVL